MSKVHEAQQILKALDMRVAQQNEMSALTLLALCDIKEQDKWKNAARRSLGLTKGIMSFIGENYNKKYAPNTRETVRDVLQEFIHASIVDYNPDNPTLAVNSPKVHYSISADFVQVVKTFGTDKWQKSIDSFRSRVSKLSEVYKKSKEIYQVPLTLPDGIDIQLSTGSHNELQAAVINDFASRFAQGGILLYIGDTADKNLYLNTEQLNILNIPLDEHSKLPDVVIYDNKRNWLFLIEVVASHGPMSDKRVRELEILLKNCNAGKIYVTVFPDFKEFKKHSTNIAWETEVWITEMPAHMIHFNGDKFLGPH